MIYEHCCTRFLEPWNTIIIVILEFAEDLWIRSASSTNHLRHALILRYWGDEREKRRLKGWEDETVTGILFPGAN